MTDWYALEAPAYFGAAENSLKQYLQRENYITRLLVVPVALSCVCLHVVAAVATIAEMVFKSLVHLTLGVFHEDFSLRVSFILLRNIPLWTAMYAASCLFDLLVLPIGTMIRPQVFNGQFAAAREYFGVSSFATPEELAKRYRELALQCHPDKGNGSHAKFTKLNEAYAMLRGEIEEAPPTSIFEVVSPLATTLVHSFFEEIPSFDPEIHVVSDHSVKLL